ncbi:MAG: DNA-processing protein DprA [Verrucomicrobia bacterium]|jgi:predicted Rossmann fold nucleotide-binding protein DprA/Smf involved in DNA uptake|nr:DNA-processing protein DprA [Verrucomicrobiota bacterium]
MNEVSDNTKAILLLTAPLIVSKQAEPSKILSLKSYNLLARALHAMGFQPKDLLGAESPEILSKLPSSLDGTNLENLLNRGFLLGQALDEWKRRSIWVVSRADPSYPRRLKSKLREQSPAVIYGCGDKNLLEKGGLAVVGSRKISEALKDYTENVGALAAEAGVQILSGAARGIDSSAMGGALNHGGSVIGVMADSLGRAALAKSNRDAFQEGRLVLISAYDPSAGFNVGHAMQRNKAIYALADAGLVVTSDFNKGGTWAGAIEQLERLHYAPVFIRNGDESGQGSRALLQRGGQTWPEPRTVDELWLAIQNARHERPRYVQQVDLFSGVNEPQQAYSERTGSAADEATEPPEQGSQTPAEQLMQAVTGILASLLAEPKSAEEIAELLQVSKAQVNTWLKQLVADGQIKKLTKPVRYTTHSHE